MSPRSPDDADRPGKRDKRSRSRVAMRLERDLGWLRAVPVGREGDALLFQAMPRAGRTRRTAALLRVDGHALSVGQRARNVVARDDRHGLARLVGDADAWLARTDQRLDLIKEALVTGAAELPSLIRVCATRGARRAAKRLPASLHGLVRDLSWGLADAPDGLELVLTWLAEGGDTLAGRLGRADEVTRALSYALAAMVADGDAAALGPWMRWECHPHSARVPVRSAGHVEALWNILGSGDARVRDAHALAPERPAPLDAASKVPAIAVALPRRSRRRFLHLVGAALDPRLLRDWDAWWKQLRPLERRVRQILADSESEKSEWEEARDTVRGALHNDIPKPPPRLDAARIADAAYALSKLHPKVGDAVLSFLEDTTAFAPAGTAAGLLVVTFNNFDEDAPATGQVIRAVGRWLRSDPARTERRWQIVSGFEQGVPKRWQSNCIDDAALALGDARSRKAWLATIDRWNERHEEAADWRVAEGLVALLALDPERSVERAAARGRTLADVDGINRWIDEDQGALAHLLAPDDPETFVALIDHSVAGGRTARDMRETVQRLDPSALALVRGLVASPRHREATLAALRHAGALRAFGMHDVGPPTGNIRQLPKWALRYPRDLHASLARLCGCHPDPEKRARSILDSDLPPPEHIERQLGFCEQKIAEGGPAAERLVGRRNTLRRYLEDPPRPTPARLGRLAEKVASTARSAALEAWQRRLGRQLSRAIGSALRSETAPPWALTHEIVDVLPYLLALTAPFRSLGLRLLRARCQPPPWDLRSHPANARFLERMRRLGLLLEPWLDGLPPRVLELDGRRATLALSADPLEIFQMGAPFGTCLSPGQMNFFSTVANAADINKRVLFARADDGAVLGRCLLALTDTGGLLTFRPYGQSGVEGFGDIVAAFARDLAAAIGAVPQARGEVQTLVASDWYDDGSYDLCGALPGLAEDSDLRRRLPELPAAEARVEIERALLPRGLDGVTLPVVLGLEEVWARGDVIAELARTLEDPASAPHDTVYRIVFRLLELDAGPREVSRLGPRVLARFERDPWLGDHQFDVMWSMAPWLPAAVLRSCRRMRRGDPRRLERSQSARRLVVAARAALAMGRPAQARTLLTQQRRVYTRDRWQRRADEVGAELSDATPARG